VIGTLTKKGNMIPIRKNELEYLEKYVKDKFIDRRKKIESEIHLETNKAIDKNFKSFLAKLDIDKDLNAIEIAKDKLEKFQDSKDNYESKLRAAVSIAAQKVEKSLKKWQSIRRWDEDNDSSGKLHNKNDDWFQNVNNLKYYLREKCADETTKLIERSDKFKEKKILDVMEEEAKNILYSGQSIQDVWKYLGSTFKRANIEVQAPKAMLQLDK
jgi:hypothetical protein